MTSLVIAADIGGPDWYHAGDEAMLAANLQTLRRLAPDVAITAISRDPDWTANHYGVRAIAPLGFGGPLATRVLLEREILAHAGTFRTTGSVDPTRPGAAIIDALAQADGLLLSGGGNLCSRWPELIHDRTTLIHLAHRLTIPAVILGQTIGPQLDNDDRDRLARALPLASLVGLRGAESVALVRSLDLDASHIIEQLDDAWFLEPSPSPAVVREAARHQRPWIAVTLAPLPGDPAGFLPILRSIARQLSELARTLDADLVFVPHWNALPGCESDALFARRLYGFLDEPHRATLLPVHTGEDICWLSRQAALVVTSRYHPLVFGLSGGVPCVAMYPDQHTRVRQLECLRQAGLEHHAISLEAALSGGLTTAALSAWDHRDAIRRQLADRTPAWRADESRRWTRITTALGWREPVRPVGPVGPVGPVLDISAVVLTRNGAGRLERCLQSIIDAGIAKELVVFVDESTTDDSEAVARRFTTKVSRIRTHGYIEFSLAQMAAGCSGAYVLRIDDDEALGGEWAVPLPESHDAAAFTHFMVPRRWLVPGLDGFLSSGEWYPDLQLRLFRNDPALIRWPHDLHEHLTIDGPGAVLWDRWIEHHVLWQQTRAEREAKCIAYQETRPDKHLSHFYLWEEQAIRLSPAGPDSAVAAAPLDDGADLSFGSDGHAAQYRLDGWSHAEPWGTWTDGPRAVLRLPLRRTPTGPIDIILDANAFLHPAHPRLRVTVSCAGTVVAEWTVETPNVTEYACTIPAALAVGSGVLMLTFHIDDPRSPLDLGQSPDARRLGLGARRLRLTHR